MPTFYRHIRTHQSTSADVVDGAELLPTGGATPHLREKKGAIGVQLNALVCIFFSGSDA